MVIDLQGEIEARIGSGRWQTKQGAKKTPDRAFGAPHDASSLQLVASPQRMKTTHRCVEALKRFAQNLPIDRYGGHGFRIDRQSGPCI